MDIPRAEDLPDTFPVRVCSQVLGIGRNRTYELIAEGKYPVRILPGHGRNHRVSRADLLAYLHAPVTAVR